MGKVVVRRVQGQQGCKQEEQYAESRHWGYVIVTPKPARNPTKQLPSWGLGVVWEYSHEPKPEQAVCSCEEGSPSLGKSRKLMRFPASPVCTTSFPPNSGRHCPCPHLRKRKPGTREVR